MGTRTYDPKNIIANVFGIPLTGWADGSFIKVTRDEDTFSKQVGAGGEIARTRNRNRGAKITFSLMATSPENDLLSAQAKLDEATGMGTGAVQIKDLNGTTQVDAAEAWISKPADVEFGKEVGAREWTIDVADLNTFAGGTFAL